jgi:hypothetical protein
VKPRAMRTRPWSASASALVAALAGAIALASACSDDNALIGGACAAGYTPSGSQCFPSPADGSTDDAADSAGDALADATDATDAPNDSPSDAPPFDGRRSDAGENDSGDDGSNDGTAGDAADACTPPYDTPAHCGDCFTVCSGMNDACKLVDGGYACVPLCDPPLSECSGQCYDLHNDPLNCGSCGHMCPSLLCLNSVCEGSTAGGIVFIGHDYETTQPATSQAHVLSNAVFLPQSNPLDVLSYEHYSSANAVAHVDTILNTVASQVGRTLVISHTSNDSDIPNTLTVAKYSVLIVHDQGTAASGAMATLGASWASTLATFVQQGGVVVVLDGGTGIGEMPQFSTATTLLSVSAQTSVSLGTPLTDVAPADAVGLGVISPYGAGKSSVSITTEPNGGNVVYVIDIAGDAGSEPPVVVHKVF